VLRSVLRGRPEVRSCLSRCRHCRIFFIADPRNAGRENLGCPFGCQEAHRKEESTRRSVAYYREAEGKVKKRLLNSKRCLVVGRPESCVAATQEESGAGKFAQPGESGDEAESRAESRIPWSAAVLEHVRVVSSLIEGRRVRREEVMEMLWKVLRQHSMARRRRLDHLVARLHQQPP